MPPALWPAGPDAFPQVPGAWTSSPWQGQFSARDSSVLGTATLGADVRKTNPERQSLPFFCSIFGCPLGPAHTS